MDTSGSTDDIRATLRRHLKESMVARDKAAVQVLRRALAAIENAEAQPVGETSQTELVLAPAQHAEVARRVITEDDARGLVATEADELLAAALHYDSLDQGEAATEARTMAEILRRVLPADA